MIKIETFCDICIESWLQLTSSQSSEQWLFCLFLPARWYVYFFHFFFFYNAHVILLSKHSLPPFSSLKLDQTSRSRGSQCLNTLPVPCQSAVCHCIARSPDTSSNKNRGDHLVRLPFVVPSKGSKGNTELLHKFELIWCELCWTIRLWKDISSCLADRFDYLQLSVPPGDTPAGLCFSLYQHRVLIYSSLSKTWTFFEDESHSYHL